MASSDLNEEPLLAGSGSGALLEDNQKKSDHALLFILLGNSALLGFNLLINAIDIYQQITNKANIGTILSQSYNIPNSITALTLCFLKPKNLKLVLITALTAITTLLCVLPIFLLVDMSKDAVYWCTIIGCALCGIFSSCCFSSTFSLASQFTTKSTGYVSSGNGLCGIIASVLRVVTKAAVSDSKVRISSAAYFFIGAAIVLASLIFFIIALRKPDVRDAAIIKSDSTTEAQTSFFSMNTWEVIKIIYPLWIPEFLNYVITLSVFPGYLANAPRNYGIGSWVPVLITSIFSVFDWIGRSMPSCIMFPSEKYGWIPIVCRLLFYPLFCLSLEGVIKVGEPIWTFCWDVLFALTNGYFGTVCMIYGSNMSALSSTNRKFASFLMSFAINGGILCAMFLAMAFPKHEILE